MSRSRSYLLLPRPVPLVGVPSEDAWILLRVEVAREDGRIKAWRSGCTSPYWLSSLEHDYADALLMEAEETDDNELDPVDDELAEQRCERDRERMEM
jgi:hypothetical protein